MGTDVLLYAEAEPTKEELANVEEIFRKHNWISDPKVCDGKKIWLEFQNYSWMTQPRVVVETLSRYFSPYNNRGYWPHIFHDIQLLRACFPDAEVFYGGDTSDDGTLVTDDRLEEYWSSWRKFWPDPE